MREDHTWRDPCKISNKVAETHHEIPGIAEMVIPPLRNGDWSFRKMLFLVLKNSQMTTSQYSRNAQSVICEIVCRNGFFANFEMAKKTISAVTAFLAISKWAKKSFIIIFFINYVKFTV
jgi:hypothetical protein